MTADRLEWDLEPRHEVRETGTALVWDTACGRYKVLCMNSRTEGVYFGCQARDLTGHYSQSPEFERARGPGYPRHYETLSEALHAASRHLSREAVRRVEDNSESVLKNFEENQQKQLRQERELCIVSQNEISPSDNGSTEMKVDRVAAVQMLRDFGFLNAPKWDDAKLLENLNNLADVDASDMGECNDEESTFLMDAVVADLKAGNKITLGDHAGNGEAPKKRGRKPVAKAAKAEKPAKAPRIAREPKEDSTERDAFGSKVGSEKARVNAVLTAKPQSLKEIKEASGVEKNWVWNHLNLTLLEAGFVEKDGKNYKLASGVKVSKKSRKKEAVTA